MTFGQYCVLHLASHDLPVGEIINQSGLTRTTVTSHLKSLRQDGLVEQKPTGHYVQTQDGVVADKLYVATNPDLFTHSQT